MSIPSASRTSNLPTCRETLVVVLASVAFLAFQMLVVGLIPAQVLMVVLFLLLFFACMQTRKLAVALLPFVLFEVCYDWMRLLPNYMVNPVDVRGIYDCEVSLFGLSGATLCEYFHVHHWPIADLLAGLFYLCWVPGPMAVGLWLYFTGQRRKYLHFAVAFVVVNWVGFAIYYLHPAAPPWYVIEHGFEPILGTPGSAAGLIRFDELVGIPVFQNIYVNNSNIFAAVPSLHAAYMLVATIYAVMPSSVGADPVPVRQAPGIPTPRWQRFAIPAVCVLITLGIWFSAVYSCHHYIIDVLLGIVTALVGIALFEYVLMRCWPVKRFMHAYERYVS